MSTFANRQNKSSSVPLSESDNDDDNEQSSSFNQQNESMMHKVKDVVSKLLHPAFLFSAGGETTRPKRKRVISIEENTEEKQSKPISTTTNITTNGHSMNAKSKHHDRTRTDDEPQLTDDEDSNGRDVPSTEQDLTEIEQQKKRRRTANYQHTISTTATTNGHHEDERVSPPLPSTNGVSSLSNRRIITNGSDTANTTPVLLQTSEQNSQEGTNRVTSSKQRLNTSAIIKPLTPNYDLSQPPLFSMGIRKTNDVNMLPNRTTTNLKSNTNEFSGNYLLASGLANRPQSIASNTQQPSSSSSNRLLPSERQMFGVNYASINSRRLPYIERLRRRTLQDCIRLNRTLDSEPLSISTIEEHTSATASPVRKSVKTLEKECGIQCNISMTDGSMEPNRKIPRTFPPADIRNEALSVPSSDKVQPTSQKDPAIQTNSSITIEVIKPIGDLKKPKVLGNVTPFSWPKFARAQEEYAKKYPEKCRIDAGNRSSFDILNNTFGDHSSAPIQAPKSTDATTSLKVSSTNTNSSISHVAVFNVSPPRPLKPPAGPIWKCPSCTMEHPAQTASCSLCHGINPNYKRLSAIESTTLSAVSTPKVPEIIVEETAASTPVTTIHSTISKESTPVTISAPIIGISKESTFPIASFATSTTSFSATGTLPLFGVTPTTITATTTKENTVINPPVTTSIGFPTATTTPLFGTNTAISDKPVTSTPANLFQINPSTPTSFPLFGSAASANSSATTTVTPTITTTSVTPSFFTTPTTTALSPIKIPTTITFGSFGSTSLAAAAATTTAVTTNPTTSSSDKTPQFSFGTNTSTLPIVPSSSITASTTPSLFGFTPSVTVSTATTNASLTLPTSSSSGFPFPSSFPLVSASITPTTTTTSSAVPLFGATSSTSGFSFPSANTTTTTSSSTPFTFGASSPPKPFAPAVISTSGITSTPAFGAIPAFGNASPATTADKAPTSTSSFSVFGSTPAPSSLFTFGATSTTTTNPVQTSIASTATTGGFGFSPGLTTATSLPAFGSAPSTFAFGSTPSSFAFGAGSTTGASPATASPSTAPFQFSAGSSTTPAGNIFSSPTVSTPENNPFSVNEEGSARRPVIRARRRGKQ